MKKNILLPLVAILINATDAMAIDPVYEGANGIREKVFATNCLACHASNLSGGARNGAPSGVNWDTFGAAKQSGAKAVKRAVELGNMPPNFSPLPKLNDEQKLALQTWQMLGFPEKTIPVSFSLSTARLTLPEVNVVDGAGNIVNKVNAELILKNTSEPFQFEITSLKAVQ